MNSQNVQMGFAILTMLRYLLSRSLASSLYYRAIPKPIFQTVPSMETAMLRRSSMRSTPNLNELPSRAHQVGQTPDETRYPNIGRAPRNDISPRFT